MDWLLSSPPSSATVQQQGKQDKLASVRRYLPPLGQGCGGGGGKSRSKPSPRGGNSGKSNKKGGSADGPLLASLRFMSNLEERKPGAGRRAFVQACVLCGCDYTPSLIAGVGTVGAFKLVNDQRMRDEAVRFRRILMTVRDKILPLVPAKDEEEESEESNNSRSNNADGSRDSSSVAESGSESESQASAASHGTIRSRIEKEKERLNEYEELLARSEAVFYYHAVLDVSECKVVNLVEPQASAPPDTSNTKGRRIDEWSRSHAEEDCTSVNSREKSKAVVDGLSAEPVNDDEATDVFAIDRDPRKFLPYTDRFNGDISFAGPLDAPRPTQVIEKKLDAYNANLLSSLTRTPSTANNKYSPFLTSSGSASIRAEKKSNGSLTLHDHFAKRAPQRQESNAPDRPKEQPSSNMFAKFAHDDAVGKTESARDSDISLLPECANDKIVDREPPKTEPASRSIDLSQEEGIVYDVEDDSLSRSRHFLKPSDKSRRVSLESPAKDSAKHEKKNVKSPASNGSGFWSDGDSNDCIIVDEPSPRKPKPNSSSVRITEGTTFASASQRQSSASSLPPTSHGGKENTANATSYYISPFQSGIKDRMNRGQDQRKKNSGKKQVGGGGGSALLAGFDRQRKRAASDGSGLIKETTSDRVARLSSGGSGGGGGNNISNNKRNGGNLKSFFQPLATKPRK